MSHPEFDTAFNRARTLKTLDRMVEIKCERLGILREGNAEQSLKLARHAGLKLETAFWSAVVRREEEIKNDKLTGNPAFERLRLAAAGHF